MTRFKENLPLTLAILLSLYTITTMEIVRRDLQKEAATLKKEVVALRNARLEDMPLITELKDAYFFKDAYCGQDKELYIHALISNTGKIKFKTRALNPGYKGLVPLKGEWWYEKGEIVFEVNQTAGKQFRKPITQVLMDKTGGIVSFFIEEVELNLVNCKRPQ